MAGRLRRYGPTVMLAGICAVLAVALWWPRESVGGRVLAPIAVPPSIAPLPPDVTVTMPPKSEFLVVAERPLFQPQRRPYVPAAIPAPPPPPAPAPPPPAIRAYTVVGVIMSGNRRLAWLKAPSGGSPSRVVEGDVVQGWRVKLIEADQVTFEAGSAEHVLTLPKRGAAARAAGSPGGRR